MHLLIDDAPDNIAPFATPALLCKTKQRPRDKDRLDRQFLAALVPPEHMR